MDPELLLHYEINQTASSSAWNFRVRPQCFGVADGLGEELGAHTNFGLALDAGVPPHWNGGYVLVRSQCASAPTGGFRGIPPAASAACRELREDARQRHASTQLATPAPCLVI